MHGNTAHPDAHRHPHRRGVGHAAGAFTLVEILIVVVIIGILATIVIPQLSSASLQARESTLRDDARFLRTQVVVYKAQHQDNAPGYPGGNTSATPTPAALVDQLTKFTNLSGATSATYSDTYKFGPYLPKLPKNPINEKDTWLIVPNGSPLPAPTGAHGWIYKPETDELLVDLPGTDLNGIPYANY